MNEKLWEFATGLGQSLFKKGLYPSFLPQFVYLTDYIRGKKVQGLKVLDVGCGDYYPSKIKRLFPFIEYYGIDIQEYENNKAIFTKNRNFFLIDLDNELEKLNTTLPDKFFDFVIMTHVIEHLKNGLEVLHILSRKIKVGGAIYIEFPSVRSLYLPSMKGTLNFCDDPTHKRVYALQEIVNVLLDEGFKIKKAGKRRSKVRILFILPFILYSLIRKGEPLAGAFWDLFAFADFVFAEKRCDK